MASPSDGPLLSIVVPVLNEARHCLVLLRQLQRWRELGCELIVVDGGSLDDSRQLVRPLADRLLVTAAGRARQMNAGAAEAKGQYLWFLHADTVLPSGLERWFQALPQLAGWGFFPVRLSGAAGVFRLIERMINWRSRLSQVATGDQGIFVSRQYFAAVGGYADEPLMEDVALTKALRKLSPPQVPALTLQTSSRRWEQRGVTRTVLLMWSLRLAYFLGVSPRQLVKFYYGH